MTNEALNIYTDNGLDDKNPLFKDLKLTSYTFKPTRMGMPDFQAEVLYAENLDNEWTGREYVVFRNERHYIRHTASATYDNQLFLWKHSCVLISESAEILGNVYFYDTVYAHALTKDKPCSNSTNVTFYGDIYELCDRINCSLKYRGIGDSILNTKTNLTTDDIPAGDGFCVMTDPFGDYDKDSSWEFSFEDKTIWEVLSDSVGITEIPFEKRGKKIIFGALPNVVEHVFEQGFDGSLLSISHKNANAKVINSVTMVGSSENIPYYYPNKTEYGHISIVAGADNDVLTQEKIKIANMTQLLSKMKPDEYAVLVKYTGTVSDAGVTVGAYRSAINGGQFTNYKVGDTIEVKSNGSEHVALWNISVDLTVESVANVIVDKIDGQVWKANQSNPGRTGDMMMARFVSLKKGSVDYSESVTSDESGIHLGTLTAGNYTLRFDIPINIQVGPRGYAVATRTWLFGISLKLEGQTVKKGYYWNYQGIDYKAGELGVVIDGGENDDMVGDSFGWTGSGRMAFQTSLMPPKYRETLGTDRFYHAVNGTYADPDTNQTYTFPNPYIEGAPVEHIYRNDKIKPTITGITNAENVLFGAVAAVEYDMNDNDALKSDGDTDSKNDSLTYEHSYFYIKLNIFNGEYGFNLFEHASQTDPMTIQMTSGSCNGCKFKVQVVEYENGSGLKIVKNPVQTTGENGTIVAGNYDKKVSRNNFQEWQQDTSTHSVWICVQKDAETFGQILPSSVNNFTVKANDTFNIINIDLPEQYILAAEKKLEEEGIRYMADNNEDKFNFEIKASRIFFAENPDVFAALDEYSKIKIKYNGQIYEQYVSGLTISVKAGEALPDIGINLTDSLAVGKGFEQRVSERAASLIANPYTLGGYAGGAGGLSTALSDRRYLNKQKADRTPHKVASDTGFEIGNFISGGQGGLFFIDPDTGHSYIEVDEMRVRMKAIFESIQIAMLESIGGEQGITPGGSVLITYVEETGTAYRCYFKGKDDDKGADCRFAVGDQVQCKTSNLASGTATNASNRYYWRLVTAVNNDESYFDLSKTDYDSASEDVPQAGDTVMQLGNRIHAQRQSAIIMSTINANAPSVILYNGIDKYSLENKSVVEYGVDKTKTPPRPFFHCFGESYTGPRDGSTYIRYTPENGVEIKGKLSVESKVGDDTLENYIKSVSPTLEQEDIEQFVNNIVDPKLGELQDQIDGAIETWFYNGVPTITTYPASEWNTEALRIQHLGDLYYDNNTGTAYRFSQEVDKTYYWNVITDDAITKALAAAQKAQDTADGKRRVFIKQPTAQQVYDIGDLWVNATYGNQYTNDLLRCVTHKNAGAAFKIAHWTLASKYTDDSALNQFILDYQDDIVEIQTQIDGKAETWYQATDPSLAWTTAELKAEHKGDLWYKTSNNSTWRWNGSAWQKQNIPDSVFDSIDGKSSIFVAKPTQGYMENDLWFLEAEYTLSGVKYPAGTLVVATQDSTAWNAAHWIKKDRYTDDTLAKEALNTYKYLKESIGDVSTTIGGLFLTSMIRVGQHNEDLTTQIVWSGLNGVRAKTNNRDIAFWAGGDLVDMFNDDDTRKTLATTVRAAAAAIRMDGSAYFCAGNVGFKKGGGGWLAGNNITWDETGAMTFGGGIKIDLGGGNNSTLGGLQNSFSSLLNIVNSLSNILYPVNESGNKVDWNSNQIYALKSVKNFFSEGEISAHGLNAIGGGSGSGGVGIDETTLAKYLEDHQYATKPWIENKKYLTSITKAQVENVLTGNITTHTHSQYLTSHQSLANYYKKTESDGRYARIAAANNLVHNTNEITMIPDGFTGSLWFNFSTAGRASNGSITHYIMGDGSAGAAADVVAASFTRVGGTSLQFLKADGSVDSNEYLVATAFTAHNMLEKLKCVDGGGSGLDADLLDGHHGSEYAMCKAANDMIHNDNEVTFVPAAYSGKVWINFRTASGQKDGDITEYIFANGKGAALAQITAGQFSGNSASATKLQTARTIWGQSFNGSGNVSGTMTGVDRIIMNGDIYGVSSIELKSATPYIDFHFNNDSGDYTSRIIERASGQLCINSAICANYNGNVGIGTVSPTEKLHVNGNAKFTGSVTAGIQNAFRAAYGNYGFIIRNDGSNTFFMLTASGDPYGSYGTLRPLLMNNSTGSVAIGDSSLFVVHGGDVTVNHNLLAKGEITAHTASDIQLKQNIRTLTDARRRLRNLGGYKVYDYREGLVETTNLTERIGLVWQDVQGHIGEMMRMKRDDGYGVLNYLCPDYINLIGAAVIESDNEVMKLKLRIKKLENEVKALKQRI